MSRSKTALWFADSFGFDIHSITLKEQKTGKHLSAEVKRQLELESLLDLMVFQRMKKKSGTSSVLAQ